MTLARSLLSSPPATFSQGKSSFGQVCLESYRSPAFLGLLSDLLKNWYWSNSFRLDNAKDPAVVKATRERWKAHLFQHLLFLRSLLSSSCCPGLEFLSGNRMTALEKTKQNRKQNNSFLQTDLYFIATCCLQHLVILPMVSQSIFVLSSSRQNRVHFSLCLLIIIYCASYSGWTTNWRCSSFCHRGNRVRAL